MNADCGKGARSFCPCGQPAWERRQGEWVCPACIQREAAYYARWGEGVKMQAPERYYLDKYAEPYRLAGSGMTSRKGLQG